MMTDHCTDLPALSQTQIDHFRENGYLTVENFLNSSSISSLKQEASSMMSLFENNPQDYPVRLFSTGTDQVRAFLLVFLPM
jgi:hypothetical protein